MTWPQRSLQSRPGACGEHLGDDLGVAAGREHDALVLELVAEDGGVDDVAVVAERELAVGAADANGCALSRRLEPVVE